MKVVIDTNCLLPSIFASSKHAILWDKFCLCSYTLCVSTDILEEYEEKIKDKFGYDIAEATLGKIINASNVLQVIPYYKWDMLTYIDPDDNKFVDCDLNSGADYIVTNDKHFNGLKKINFPSIKVIGIEEFKRILTNEINM